MYTVLRISGVVEQLEQLCRVLEKRHRDLLPEIDRRGELVCRLSQKPGIEHWADVADALYRVSGSISETGVGDIGLVVDTAFNRKQLPDGGVAFDTLSVSQIALEAMAEIGADFEAAVYRTVGDDEV